MSDKPKMENRKNYRPPQIRRIELVTDEVLIVGCKAAGYTNVRSPACGTTSNCAGLGS